MQSFSKEFNTLSYIIEKSSSLLLVAHSRPDGDTTGSVVALKEYMTSIGKHADIACYDPFPSYLTDITSERFEFPDHLNLKSYDAVIGCDSVERGFHTIIKELRPDAVTVIIDHHPDITISADVVIIDASCSSTCEMVYEFFAQANIPITSSMASALMVGILSDTGNFQHSNTSSRVMVIASELLRRGASLSKIVDATFANKKIATLKLWGKAFEKARINPNNGMISTVLTNDDIAQCSATTEDIAQVATVLNTVPGTKFALVLSQRENGIIKGSLRSESYKGVDVSEIAHRFGGGGHKLASGFEMHGKIVETEDGWEVQ